MVRGNRVRWGKGWKVEGVVDGGRNMSGYVRRYVGEYVGGCWRRIKVIGDMSGDMSDDMSDDMLEGRLRGRIGGLGDRVYGG